MKKLIVAMVLVAGVAAHATSFSYQGALRNADGSAITDRTKKIIFRIYKDADGGQALWVGQQTVAISPTNGLFNVEISDTTYSYEAEMKQENRPLLDELFASSKDLYIGLDVYDTPNGLSGEIRPRQRILSVPTANYARNVSKAMRDFTVESNLVVYGTMKVESNVTFNANATFNGAVKIDATTTFTGDATFSGTLSAMVGNKAVEVMPVPIGGIIMWSQSNAPNGEKWATGAKDETGHWAICDGTKINGVQTPDLRGRFIVGARSGVETKEQDEINGVYSVAVTGGTNQVALTKEQMPNHYHLYPNDDSLYDRDALGRFNDGEHFSNNAKNDFDFSSDGKNKDHVYKTGTAGGDATDDKKGTDNFAYPHQNLPPYYALYYIMRVR